MPRRVSLLLLVLFTVLAGCDSGGDDPPPSINGTWEGQFVSGDDVIEVRMELVEAATFVSGNGQLTLPTEQVTFTVSGSYLHPVLNLELRFAARPPGSFNGTVAESRDDISGNIGGSGFSGTVSLGR